MIPALIIDRLSARTPEERELAFRSVALHPVACNNWAAEYPYAPQVGFRIFHDGERLYLRFEVRESCTRALVEQDNGEVWTDSCVEFFLTLDEGEGENEGENEGEKKRKEEKEDDKEDKKGETGYYNFECSCAGRLLLAFRKRKPEPEYAPPETMRSIERIPSLGSACFAEREGDNRWTLTLAIPAAALFRHRLRSWSGVEARMNLYKCGDGLSRPHFLSWMPVEAPAPDFHRPECFRTVKFNR